MDTTQAGITPGTSAGTVQTVPAAATMPVQRGTKMPPSVSNEPDRPKSDKDEEESLEDGQLSELDSPCPLVIDETQDED